MKLKRTAAAVTLICLALALSACGGKEEPSNEFVGKWYCVSVEQVDNVEGLQVNLSEEAKDHSTAVIRNNGKAVIKLKSAFTNQTISGTWEYSGGDSPQLLITGKNGETMTVHLDSYQNIYVEDKTDSEMFACRYCFFRK